LASVASSVVLIAKQISKSIGGRLLVDGVSLTVGPRSRIGVVGPNGIGKSTLLRILAGLDSPDTGVVERSPAALTVGYLTQEPDAAPGESLRRYLARRTGVAAAEAELDRLTAALVKDESKVDDYSEALDRFLALGGADFEARAATVCADLGLPADRIDVAVGDLSGGQAARAGLAAILLARFDVFLLDEPTNDLDFAGLDHLQRFLAGLAGGVVVVSHDRAFLDQSVDRIIEIQEESHRAVEYAGAWSDYVAARALARGQQEESYKKFTEERRQLTQRIRTQRTWAEEGVRKAKKKPKDHDKAQQGFFNNRTEHQAAKVRASQQKLARLEVIDKPWEGWQLNLDLAPTRRSGDVVARLDEAAVRRGSFVLGPLDLEIGWQDRVAILGPNGGGKSTLLGAILGELELASGRRYVGPGVVFGRLDQQRSTLGADGLVLDGFMAGTGLGKEEARSLLAKFGVGAGHVGRPAGSLSPGERTRVLLAVLMAQGVNCLVLDEPTNHLDLAAIEQLEEALDRFEGTLILVTHDRWLLESVHLTRTVTIDGGAIVATESTVTAGA
jgi:ATPase subunit of ABC transporter with duplicated ATPase domains